MDLVDQLFSFWQLPRQVFLCHIFQLSKWRLSEEFRWFSRICLFSSKQLGKVARIKFLGNRDSLDSADLRCRGTRQDANVRCRTTDTSFSAPVHTPPNPLLCNVWFGLW